MKNGIIEAIERNAVLQPAVRWFQHQNYKDLIQVRRDSAGLPAPTFQIQAEDRSVAREVLQKDRQMGALLGLATTLGGAIVVTLAPAAALVGSAILVGGAAASIYCGVRAVASAFIAEINDSAKLNLRDDAVDARVVISDVESKKHGYKPFYDAIKNRNKDAAYLSPSTRADKYMASVMVKATTINERVYLPLAEGKDAAVRAKDPAAYRILGGRPELQAAFNNG